MNIPSQCSNISPFQEKRVTSLAALLSAGFAGVLCAVPGAWADAAPVTGGATVIDASVVPTPIVTAPSIRPNVLVPNVAPAAQPIRQGNLLNAGNVAPDRSAPTVENASPLGEPAAPSDAVPWVLATDLHPWPLRFREAPPLNSLYLSLPSEQEARLMLPGRAADAAQDVRYSISKYVSDLLGMAAQARGRQTEALDTWLTQTETQRRQLSADPWQVYEFSLESRREIEPFRKKVAEQTSPAVNRMATDVRSAIARIAPLVNAMPTFELRTAWYNTMVQLKEGLMMYQAQTASADRQLLLRVDDYIRDHPVAPRPAGEPPAERKLGAAKGADGAQAGMQPGVVPAPAVAQAPREQSKVPAKPEAGSSLGGLVAVGVILMGFAGLVIRLRRKIGSRAPKPDSDA